MVNDFPFEYMHLICLGATKKILKLWTDKKLSRHRLRSKEIIRISDHLEYTKKFVTNDFARKPRTLGELDRWKATELRTFLLYTGPIVLKNNISDKYYRNFMLLSVATRLLAEPCQSKENINYAEQLLEYFVHNFMEIYGKENVSYNIHGLIHIANDVRLHGNLDKFSAFKFENYLYQLKRLIRSSAQPLPQLHRRLAERECGKFKTNEHEADAVQQAELTSKLIVRTNTPNNFVLLNNGYIISVTNINKCGETELVGRRFKESKNLFSYPCDSKLLDIYKVKFNNLTEEIFSFNLLDIKYKLVAITKLSYSIGLFPILHSKFQDGEGVRHCEF